MKINKLTIYILLSIFLFTSNCKNPFRYTDATETPVSGPERARKNVDEGRAVTFGTGNKSGGVFDFASSNELWRATIEVLDFVSFTNASYSGGILITDWFSGNTSVDNSNLREIKITVRFLSNEIRADGIEIIIHEKVCSLTNTKKCKIQKIKSEIGSEIKLAILKKATFYKKNSNKKKKKKS